MSSSASTSTSRQLHFEIRSLSLSLYPSLSLFSFHFTLLLPLSGSCLREEEGVGGGELTGEQKLLAYQKVRYGNEPMIPAPSAPWGEATT